LTNFENIQIKLHQFIKKYYVNQLIKGVLIFFALGLLYFIFTLFIEYFLWLKPIYRSILFWLFILVEVALVIIFIIIPIAKLIGLKDGISEVKAAKIIGNYFPEVNDKLLNMLQLSNINEHSELIQASIDQRSKRLQEIPFKKAIHFSKNKKYLKYAVLPITIIGLIFLTGNKNSFNQSFNRVINYKAAYQKPAPFHFYLLNGSLYVVEGNSLKIQLKIEGAFIPNEVSINFNNQSYYMIDKGLGKFEFTFAKLNNPIAFYFQANGFSSQTFNVVIVNKPSIIDMKMVLKYPSYTLKQNEVMFNTGNVLVPEGTTITWQLNTQNTDSVRFFLNDNFQFFKKHTNNYFSFTYRIKNLLKYKISVSNQQLFNYESLNYTIKVIKDEYPKISVVSNIDSISRGPVQFAGQVSDDYKVRSLQLVYYTADNPEIKYKTPIIISKNTISDFYYIFPTNEKLSAGKNYEMYFEVYDNDAINGSKKTKSKRFAYYLKTKKEILQDIYKEQENTLTNFSKTFTNNNKSNRELEAFKNKLKSNTIFNFQDAKVFQQLVTKQNNYLKKLLEQTEAVDKNLKEVVAAKSMLLKKEDLQKRIEETKELLKKQKTWNELNKLTEKLKKEDLLKKLDELSKKNKRNNLSLERLLELTKRFYIEQKYNQLSEKIKQLSKNQTKIAKEKLTDSSVTKQQNINIKFNQIEKDLNKLYQQNEQLNRPLKLKEYQDEADEINKNIIKAKKQLENKNSNAAKSQKSAARKMNELSTKMQNSMTALQGEQIDENIDDLRKIVDNLLEFSFMQENLYEASVNIDNKHPNYAINLRKQQTLKEYFSHIDDSLYVLSLRMVKMSNTIQTEVSNTHYYLDQALSNFSDNNFDSAISDERFVITSVNNLANMLSKLLESLLNASPRFGKGKSGNKEFNLPDIIKKQGDLIKKMEEFKDGKKGNKAKKGENGNINELDNAELYEIYKQQAFIKEMLAQLIKKNSSKFGNGNNPSKKMDELEQEIIKNGITKNAIEKMKEIKQELLKFEKALKKQGNDTKRNSKSGNQNLQSVPIQNLQFKKEYFNKNEILNRQSLPLRSVYKKKVNEYFKD
jgi:hypothetical protein